jgi:hypothetical protein
MTGAMMFWLAVAMDYWRRGMGLSRMALMRRSERAVKLAPVSISMRAVMMTSRSGLWKAAFVQRREP